MKLTDSQTTKQNYANFQNKMERDRQRERERKSERHPHTHTQTHTQHLSSTHSR